VDVQKVAARFGGGGHVAAAGAELSLSPSETAEQVLAALREQLS
jgi:phosphoesterase RecJ-like protein